MGVNSDIKPRCLRARPRGGTRDKISKLSNERLVRARQFKVDHDGHIRDAGLMGPDSSVWISPDPAASKKTRGSKAGDTLVTL